MGLKKGIFVLIIFSILLIGIVNASFSISNYSITKNYNPSANLNGWINISLNNEPTNSVIQDSLGNSISLIDLLKNNPNAVYSCNTADCGVDYVGTYIGPSKNFELNPTESEIIGFKFTGELNSINSINLTITSNAVDSCYNQLKVDILKDGIIDIGNNKVSGISLICGDSTKDYGCFDDELISNDAEISSTPYCQRIELPESPGFRAGAWIKEETAGDKELSVGFYRASNGEAIEGAYCVLPAANNTGKEVSCDINYVVTEKEDYYVCLYSDDETGRYYTKGYASVDGCGFYGAPISNEGAAYKIFVERKAFGVVGELNITNALSDGKNFGGLVSEYIADKYGSFNCTNSCFVPVKIIGGAESQSITVKNLVIEYVTKVMKTKETNFYDLNFSEGTANSGFQKLSLDGINFTLPSSYGNTTYKLKFNDEEIFSENIFIEKIPIIKSMNPLSTASAYPTRFEVAVEASRNITKYEWNFGDGKIAITQEKGIIHTYEFVGNYNLNISVTDVDGRTSKKTFKISVGTPEDKINQSLKSMGEDLTSLKASIEDFSDFEKERLNAILNTNNLDDDLTQLQRDFKNVKIDEDYNDILKKILNMSVPRSVTISSSTDYLLFFPKKEHINLEIVKGILGGNYDSKMTGEYKDGIIFWMLNNIDTKLKSKKFTAQYEQYADPILSVFELKISEKERVDYDYYLIVEDMTGFSFDDNYLEEGKDGYQYIRLKEENIKITFSTTEDVEFSEVPAFISPGLNKLDLVTPGNIEDFVPSKKKWYIFGLFMLILFIMTFITYIILQRWYKIKYENYLFRNRNNVYNLITFLNNSKKKRLEDNAIISSLRKSGWNSEQITYIMRKYEGKRTGMFEISPRRIFTMFKRRKEPPQAIGRVPYIQGPGFRPKGPPGMPPR